MSKFLALTTLVTLALAVPAPRQAAGKGPHHLSPCSPRSHTFLPRGHHSTLPVELGFNCQRMQRFHRSSRSVFPLNSISSAEHLSRSTGYGYVQVNPAAEHIQGSQWWTDYQVVSYKLQSKRGTPQQYQNMINTCHAAGVKVIAGMSVPIIIPRDLW